MNGTNEADKANKLFIEKSGIGKADTTLCLAWVHDVAQVFLLAVGGGGVGHEDEVTAAGEPSLDYYT